MQQDARTAGSGAGTEAADELLYTVEDGIGRVVFNRPHRRNALTFAMYERLTEICRTVPTDGSVKAIVMTGAGEKAFAAGTDISAFKDFSGAEDGLAYEENGEKVLEAIERCPVPTIAAICGACTGGGAGIAVACDLRIASADARFGFPIARTLGNCLSMENYARLAAVMGPARVMEMILMARLVEAEEAQRIGLVSQVLPDREAVLARADEIAATLAGHAPLTMRVTKEALRRLRTGDGDQTGRDLIATIYGSEDFREGMAAFLEKRPPRWSGR